MPQAPAIPDKRQAVRIPVALPVLLAGGQGVTRDVSHAGVFFTTTLPFAVGASLDFSLVFERADSTGPLRLHCHGRVVRVEPGDRTTGVAVAVTSQVLDPGGSRSVIYC